MRVLVLGGAGAVCQYTTRDLAAFSDFQEIVIGDYNLVAAYNLADEIDDPRIKVVQVDASVQEELLGAIRGFDVVVNGLPWEYDLAVTKACIEAGVNGLDVSTEEEQWDLDGIAREKNVVFVPGVGATPGITNMMACKGAKQLDEVDDISINFAAFRCPAPAPGLLITLLWEFHPDTEERLVYQDGAFHWVGPFEGGKSITFPGPIGEQMVYYIPHPETRTMPKSLGAGAVSVHGCFPPHVMRLVSAMLESGLYSDRPVQLKGVQTTPFDIMFDLLLQLPESKQTPLWAYGLVVEVSGKHNGENAKFTYWNSHPPQEKWGGQAAYYKNIAIPLSIGAQLIARGDVMEKGVIPPETAYEPELFIQELARRDILIHERRD
ncbi:MAG: saccharopine dehydrogenase NADP-binding domain-containing protein [Anaerolineales bacterium]|nr:saccharopine dehydrogenase NADP-binding domain-containing protein [Anaerolineales bacterium]